MTTLDDLITRLTQIRGEQPHLGRRLVRMRVGEEFVDIHTINISGEVVLYEATAFKRLEEHRKNAEPGRAAE